MVARRRNVTAFERTLAALRAGGRLEEVDAALVAAGRTLAALMDDPHEPTTQASWAYLAVLRELKGSPATDGDNALTEIIAALAAGPGDAPTPEWPDAR
jgi:hypothetical protein